MEPSALSPDPVPEQESQENEEGPWFEVDLDRHGLLSFGSYDEFSDWLSEEIAAWAFDVDQKPPEATEHGISSLQRVYRQQDWPTFRESVRKSLRTLTEPAKALRDDPTDENTETLAVACRRVFGGSYFPASSPSGAHLLSQQADKEFYPTLAFLSNQRVLDLERPTVLRAVLEAFLAERGLLHGLDSTGALHAKFEAEIARATSQRRQLEQLISKLDFDSSALVGKAGKQFEAQLQSHDTKHSELLNSLQTDFDETNSNAKKAFDETNRTYDEHMSLRAPVDYWQGQKEEHNAKATAYRNSSILTASLVVAVILGLAHLLLRDGAPAVWSYFVLVTVATVGFAVLRILVRVWMSHQHLGLASAERVVMIKTYLALIRTNDAASSEDKGLVLAALFSSSSTGIVKEDGMPSGLLEVISKSISKT